MVQLFIYLDIFFHIDIQGLDRHCCYIKCCLVGQNALWDAVTLNPDTYMSYMTYLMNLLHFPSVMCGTLIKAQSFLLLPLTQTTRLKLRPSPPPLNDELTPSNWLLSVLLGSVIRCHYELLPSSSSGERSYRPDNQGWPTTYWVKTQSMDGGAGLDTVWGVRCGLEWVTHTRSAFSSHYLLVSCGERSYAPLCCRPLYNIKWQRRWWFDFDASSSLSHHLTPASRHVHATVDSSKVCSSSTYKVTLCQSVHFKPWPSVTTCLVNLKIIHPIIPLTWQYDLRIHPGFTFNIPFM